jgi:hypothetical protein
MASRPDDNTTTSPTQLRPQSVTSRSVTSSVSHVPSQSRSQSVTSHLVTSHSVTSLSCRVSSPSRPNSCTSPSSHALTSHFVGRQPSAVSRVPPRSRHPPGFLLRCWTLPRHVPRLGSDHVLHHVPRNGSRRSLTPRTLSTESARARRRARH